MTDKEAIKMMEDYLADTDSYMSKTAIRKGLEALKNKNFKESIIAPIIPKVKVIKRRKVVTAMVVQEINKLFNNGMKRKDIALKLEIARGTVDRYIKQ